MRKIPLKLRKEMSDDPYYKSCLRKKEGNCKGRITWEHCWMYAGKQINEKWAIIPLCEYHHLGQGLNKKLNHWFSVNRMTEDDIKKYPKFNWLREKIILNKLFKK